MGGDPTVSRCEIETLMQNTKVTYNPPVLYDFYVRAFSVIVQLHRLIVDSSSLGSYLLLTISTDLATSGFLGWAPVFCQSSQLV